MPLTDDFTWRLGDTGVILNSDVTATFVDIENVKGYDSAPFRTTERDHEGDDGGFMDAEFEKGRDIVLDGTIYGSADTLESYLDSLKENWAPSRVQIPLYVKAPGVTERVLFGKPLGIKYDWSAARRTSQITVQFGFYAEDPRIYDASLLTANLPLGATVFSGFGFNLAFNFGFGGVSSTNDAVQVVNGGNRPTPPVIRINGPIENPILISDTAGKTMTFSPLTLLSGEYIDVDMKNKTVKLNGNTNRRNTLIAPTWFYLEKGANTLRLRASSSDPTAFATVSYRPAWR